MIMTDRKMTRRMPILLWLWLLLLLLSVVRTTASAFVPNNRVKRTSFTTTDSLLLTAKSDPTSSDNNNNAAASSSSSSVAAPRPASSLPPRQSKTIKNSSSSSNSSSQKKKKQNNNNNNKKKKKQQKSSLLRNRPLSEDEIADHVSNLYLHGPGGILRGKVREVGVAMPPHDDDDDNDDYTNEKHAVMKMRHNDDDNDNDDNDKDTIEQNKSSTSPSSAAAACSQKEYYHKLDRHPTLVLNADYQPISHLPLSLWHWQEAVKSVFTGKVHVVDVYPDVTIRAANLEIPLPSVIALTEYVPQHHYIQKPAFTKRNVFLRDEYRCQYCNQRFHTRDLSLDHVHPRCMGGRLHWENAVTACSPCNGKKGSRAVSELRSIGMRLLRPPRIPTQYELAAIAGRMVPRKVHPTWEPFLGMASSAVGSGSSRHGGGSSSKSIRKQHNNKAKSMGEQQQQQQQQRAL